jgi:hypothetical protein
VLSLILLFGFTETTPAYESFTTTISFYQEFTISSGMTEIDPTVITIIIGDAGEIEIISAPDLSPLFEFNQEVDLYFGLTSDPDDPIEVIAEQIAGMAVLEDTAFEDVTDDLLATLDFME